MKNSPLMSYGFEYKYNGTTFVFDVVAFSETEAKERVEQMGVANFIAKLSDLDMQSPNV